MSRHCTRYTCCTVDGDISHLTYRHDGGIQWQLSRETQLWGWKKKRAALLNPPESFQLSISACPSSRFSAFPRLAIFALPCKERRGRCVENYPFPLLLSTPPYKSLPPLSRSTPSCLTIFPCHPAQLFLGQSKAPLGPIAAIKSIQHCSRSVAE